MPWSHGLHARMCRRVQRFLHAQGRHQRTTAFRPSRGQQAPSRDILRTSARPKKADGSLSGADGRHAQSRSALGEQSISGCCVTPTSGRQHCVDLRSRRDGWMGRLSHVQARGVGSGRVSVPERAARNPGVIVCALRPIQLPTMVSAGCVSSVKVVVIA